MTHIQTLQKKLGEAKLDCLLISSAYNIAYLTGFFGFSKIEREGYILVTNKHTYFFASGLNSEAVSEHIDTPPVGGVSLVEISPHTPLTKKALLTIIKKEKLKRLAFEKHHLTFAEYERLRNDLSVSLIPTEHMVEELRMVKTADEIASIEKACELGDKAFDYVLSKIKEGITEKDLAYDIEHFIRKANAEISFPPIVAFGPHASIPHHVTNDKGLMMNDKFVLLDFGVKIDNYCSDMTRTVFFGKASKEQKRMYQTVLNAQQEALAYIQNTKYKILTSKADKAARNYITSKGFPTIPHSLGHGIGLEVHEPPRLSIKSTDELKPNMVFSIEPGIYLPGIGGIRIEDLVVLEEKGPRLLTKAPRNIIEI